MFSCHLLSVEFYSFICIQYFWLFIWIVKLYTYNNVTLCLYYLRLRLLFLSFLFINVNSETVYFLSFPLLLLFIVVVWFLFVRQGLTLLEASMQRHHHSSLHWRTPNLKQSSRLNLPNWECRRMVPPAPGYFVCLFVFW